MVWHPGSDEVPAGISLPIQLLSPVEEQLSSFAEANSKLDPMPLRAGEFEGKTLAICGAGPSLDVSEIDADMVWGCNSALPWLIEQGVHVYAGVAIDQTEQMVDEWASAPDVPYFLASTVNPKLSRHLLEHGRSIRWFHSAVGFPDELDAYKNLWPKPMFVIYAGRNVVGRAVVLAQWLGFEHIDVHGADHAFIGDLAHANGDNPQDAYGDPMILRGKIDGRMWHTRPDMLIAAVDLARWTRASGGNVRLIGDTLPAALLDKDDAFLDRVCRQLAPDEAVPTDIGV